MMAWLNSIDSRSGSTKPTAQKLITDRSTSRPHAGTLS
jgi:hypothetical protein